MLSIEKGGKRPYNRKGGKRRKRSNNKELIKLSGGNGLE